MPQPQPLIAPPGGFVAPVKRSITIAGHPTSISLEPVARDRAVPLSALVAELDALRVAQAAPPNLASVLRSWLITQSANYSQ